MAPLLAWTSTNTARYDRVELVPLPLPTGHSIATTTGASTASGA